MNRSSNLVVARTLAMSCTLLVASLEPAFAAEQPAAPPTTTTTIAPTVRAMTLTEALAYARAHQPAIRAAMARVTAAGEEAKIASAQWRPLVGVTAQIYGATANNTTGTYLSPTFMDVPRIGATRATSFGSFNPYAATFVGAGLTQEVFDFGRIAAQRAAADALIDVEKQRASTSRLDIDFGVEEAYYAVFAAKGVLAASEGAFERARTHRDFAKAGVDQGLRPPIELTRAEADLTRFDLGRVRARAGVMMSQSVLAAAVGAPDMMLDVSGAAPTPAQAPTLADAMQRAAARDPRILEALSRLKAQEERTRAIAAESRPDFSLTATLSGRAGGAPPSSGDLPPGAGFVPAVPNYDVGLVFTWPIFNPVVDARANASRAREDERREEIALVRREQVAAIQQAYVTLEAARMAMPALERALEAAKANYAQADARFRAGLGTSVELADAEGLRAQSEIDLALGAFEVARARAAFGRIIAEGL